MIWSSHPSPLLPCLVLGVFVTVFHRDPAWQVQKNTWKGLLKGHFKIPIFTNSSSFFSDNLNWLMDANGPFPPLILWNWMSAWNGKMILTMCFIKAGTYLMSFFTKTRLRKVSGCKNKAVLTGLNCSCKRLGVKMCFSNICKRKSEVHWFLDPNLTLSCILCSNSAYQKVCIKML